LRAILPKNSVKRVLIKSLTFNQSTAMRKFPIFSAVLFLFLLVPASITRAQTVTTEKGLTTAKFTTGQGDIHVYLPDDMRPGDVISGTVSLEPAGRNDRQKEKNLSDLKACTIRIESTVIRPLEARSTFKLNMPADGLQKAIEFSMPGAGSQKIVLPDSIFTGTEPAPDRCAAPTHVLTGRFLSIPGNFDGSLSNTQCALNGSAIPLLTESPRSLVIQWPLEATNRQQLSIREGGQGVCLQEVSGVDMIVTTGKLNLRRGEKTFIDVKVTGLEGLPDKATLTIVNTTPNIVTMANGNTQVYTIWPPADSANGVFQVHCPANSISVGNFTVSLNLALPEKGQALTGDEEIPPGYIKKNCSCSVNATIAKTGNSYSAAVNGQCTGAYGIGIQTFCRCEVLNTRYAWTITSTAGSASLRGAGDGASVSVNAGSGARYTLCVAVTVICIDGTRCTTTVCVNETGQAVDGPGTQPREPTRPPTQPEPPPTTTTRNKCKCECTVKIKTAAVAGKNYSYALDVNGKCSGTFGTGSSQVVCAAGPLTYAWQVIGGDGKAAISGPANGAGVTVGRTEIKPFVLRVTVTVTCNDGTTCECSDEIEIPGEETKTCSPRLAERVEPQMDGKLAAWHAGIAKSPAMPRDEFIVLQAEGADWDQLVFRCEPAKPDCPDEPSEKVIPLSGRVRFEWEITGEGNFVQLGCMTETKLAEGERVIFKPFYVPLPIKAGDTTLTTRITLRIIDDGSAIADETKEKLIEIRLKRSKANPDKYQVAISGGEGNLPAAPQRRERLQTCRTVGPDWVAGDDLTANTIQKPAVPDAGKMLWGQWIVLSAEPQNDQDKARFNCTSAAQCITSARDRNYPERVDYSWNIVKGGGRFILGNTGRVVVYEAPTSAREDSTEVIIKVTMKNPPDGRADPEKRHQEMIVYYYRPGIRLEYPELTWLPEDSNQLQLRSTLQYKSREWKTAPAHACRIHFFELQDVSTEKGISINFPESRNAQDCRDLLLKNSDDQEAFDNPRHSGRCTDSDMFIQARSKLPLHSCRVTIDSRDFGSHGFLRSFGNINKKTRVEGLPVYMPVVIGEEEIRHPMGFRKKRTYSDNRVTIPRDINENWMADGGWPVFGGGRLSDIDSMAGDPDNEPAGDGFNGDGLANYEEYRGFMVRTGNEHEHVRTHYLRKDIFIRNRDRLNLNLYARVSELDVHEIDSHQYVSDQVRVVNANFNRQAHVVNQMGLLLVDRGHHSSLLGVAISTTMNPAIPNLEREIRIYSRRIQQSCQSKNMPDSFQLKLAAVTAHELLHANNVCHHGEGDPEQEGSANNMNGLRSGNMSCVMRYDNTGTPLRGWTPEAIGSSLCTSGTGTGYNADNRAFGNAARLRGNCRGQIRVSGRGNPPRSCGNR
jgi:hypothetical protein